MKNLAQIPNPFSEIEVPIKNVPQIDPNNTSVGIAIGKLLPYVFSAAALIMLVYFVLAGLQLMTSRGEPKAIEAAKAKITTSLIGFAIIFLAYFIVKLLGQVFGIIAFQYLFR